VAATRARVAVSKKKSHVRGRKRSNRTDLLLIFTSTRSNIHNRNVELAERAVYRPSSRILTSAKLRDGGHAVFVGCRLQSALQPQSGDAVRRRDTFGVVSRADRSRSRATRRRSVRVPGQELTGVPLRGARRAPTLERFASSARRRCALPGPFWIARFNGYAGLRYARDGGHCRGLKFGEIGTERYLFPRIEIRL
jgi:hypothetical protein